VVGLLRDDSQQSRHVRLGLTETEDEFKVSDVAPEATSEEDVSAG
jgi:hypothetical protein